MSGPPLTQSAYNAGRAFNYLLTQQDFGGGSGGSVTINMDTLLISGSRNSNTVIDQYLRTEDGVPMNQAPVLLSNSLYKIYAISVTTEQNSTCSFEVHNDGVLIPGAVVSLNNEKEKYINVNIDVVANSKIMIYNNGTSNKPKVSVFLKKPLI